MTLIHALFAALRHFKMPDVVSDHHMWAYVVVGSVAPLLFVTMAARAALRSDLNAAPA
jgi:hypothetical protein